jgi:hypothetical protein
MQVIYLVLSSAGDDSNGIHWFKNIEEDTLLTLIDIDWDKWGSSDGLQYREYYFPDDFKFQDVGIEFEDWSDIND